MVLDCCVCFSVSSATCYNYMAKMIYTVFGCNNPTGEFFCELVATAPIEVWGRKRPRDLSIKFVECDLTADFPLPLNSIRGIVVSFAPIWLLSEFLTRVFIEQPEKLSGLKGIIAVSSSSYLTKRFALLIESAKALS